MTVMLCLVLTGDTRPVVAVRETQQQPSCVIFRLADRLRPGTFLAACGNRPPKGPCNARDSGVVGHFGLVCLGDAVRVNPQVTGLQYQHSLVRQMECEPFLRVVVPILVVSETGKCSGSSRSKSQS